MRKTTHLFVATVIIVLAAMSAAAQYPVKPIRLVVPYPPGGGSDTVGRAVAEKLSARLGKPIVVENKPGAASRIGTEAAARSAPDGYTLLLSSISGSAIGLNIYRDFPVDIRRDFAPISKIGRGTIALVVSPSLGVQTVQELVALAKTRPGQLDFASSGAGGQIHLSGELFKQSAGIDIVHVPYKGTPQFLPDLMEGRVAMAVDNLAPYMAHIKSGRVRALAVAAPQRSILLPNVPTMTEVGLPGVATELNYALLAPAGVSKEIIARLNRETNLILQQADLREKLASLGIEVGGSTPEALQVEISEEFAKWAKVIKNAGIKPE